MDISDGEKAARGAVLRAASQDARIADLEAALRPFANAVFNDNGDVSIEISRLNTDDYRRAYRAMRGGK